MELPFAVESPEPPRQQQVQGTSLQHSSASSSLVTASSQGSLMNSSLGASSPLPPNTPQDVVLPFYDDYHGQQHRAQQRHQGIPTSTIVTTTQPTDDDGFGEPEIIDFTYVNVCETDADEVDILIEGADPTFRQENQRGDVLTVLLSGMHHNDNDALVTQTEEANKAAIRASEAKKNGDLQESLDVHTQAAKMYRDIAIAIRERNASMANCLLLLSQTHAKSALALKRILKLCPSNLHPSAQTGANNGVGSGKTAEISRKERLRAFVRGALGSHHPHEEDISDSTFLGRASPLTPTTTTDNPSPNNSNETRGTLLAAGHEPQHNPVDDMMELERELRDMDMALELGNSISSLDSRMQNRMKNSMVDGSFMVVPPGSNSYMSSSMWGSGHMPINNTRPSAVPPNSGTAGVRARANRVQNKLGASAAPSNRPVSAPYAPTGTQTGAPMNTKAASPGLESSWWGNASTASQVLSSSVISLGSRSGVIGMESGTANDLQGVPAAHTKQLMRLMDSLKTLGDENAALLREVEDAEAARAEAKTAREQMKRFKEEYGKRFAALKAALEKFRKDHPDKSQGSANPVNTSDFVRSASVSEQLQRQEQLIRKLTNDLKKEKEESKKKDAALRKYESFYREVKARSAQKAAQRQMETQLRQQKARASTSRVTR